MSSHGRAVDLLLAWKEHPDGCPGVHAWGDDSAAGCLSAGDVVELLREQFKQDEQDAAAVARLRVPDLARALEEESHRRTLVNYWFETTGGGWVKPDWTAIARVAVAAQETPDV